MTVFVTTHFLEEVEYCDWVAFIDAGRLIANTAPETLRRDYSDGYGISIDLPDAERPRARAVLENLAIVRSTPTGFQLAAGALTPELLEGLDRIVAGARAEIRIEQTPMTDVFRRVLDAQETPS